MAAFSSQISFLDPILPDPEKLQEILDIFSRDSNSTQLEAKIKDLGFSHIVVEKLRENHQFLHFTIETLQKKLEEIREEQLGFRTEDYRSWIEKSIINDDLSLFSMLIIAHQDEVIRRLEYKWDLPVTGDFNSMLENYRRTKYTRQCFHYGHSPNFCMTGAAHQGHLDIVKEALERGADNYDWAQAVRCDHRKIVEMISNRDAYNYDGAMRLAAYCGHTKIVRFLLEQDAKNYNHAMILAAQNGHIEIVKMMLMRIAEDYNLATIYVPQGGHIEIVKRMLELNDKHYEEAMTLATQYGHKEIVEMMLKLSSKKYNWAMKRAVEGDHEEIAEFIRKYRDGELP